jgi:ABC-2 type transport system permease protein
MSRLVADIVNYGKQYLRSKIGLFFALIFPILLILVFGSIFVGGGDSKITLNVQNLDAGTMGDTFLASLNGTKTFNIIDVPTGENITEYIKNKSLTVAMVIPENFTADVQARLMNSSIPGNVNVIVYGDPSKTTYNVVLGATGAVTNAMNFGLANATPIVGVEGKPFESTENFNYMDYYLPGIVGMTVMTNALFAMTSICAEYRQRNYFKLLATTNIKKWEWLISKFIFYAVLLSAALVLTYLVGVAAFNMKSVLTPMAFVLIAAGAFTFTSMGMLLGVFIKDPEGAVAVANAVGFPMMFLSGSFFPLEVMPSYLQAIAGVLPLTYLNNGLRDTMVYFNDGSALVNLAVVFVCGLVFFILASKLMSWKEK